MNTTRTLAGIAMAAAWFNVYSADELRPPGGATGEKPMVTNPMRDKEPMTTKMKRDGMLKEDVRKQALEKERAMRDAMKQEEMKK